MHYTALLDANVLVPYTLTDVLMRLAEAGLYRPLWSTTILAEAERTLIHLHPEIPSATLHHRLSAMGQFFPDATVTGWDDLVNSLTLPDPDDRYVHAAPSRRTAAAAHRSPGGPCTRVRPSGSG